MPELNDPVEGPVAYDTIARGLPQSIIKKSNDAQLDIYVDPIGGSDTNDGSQASPVRTLLQVDAMIPLVVDLPVLVHLSSGVHLAPERGWWLSSRIIRGGYIRVYADEAFDAAVYTAIATGTAQAGTDQVTLVTTGGLTVDQWARQTMEFTSGAAAGWRQLVQSNDATNVLPVQGFDLNFDVALPADGDTFRIFEIGGCEIRLPLNNAPVGGVFGATYQFAQRMHGAGPFEFAASTQRDNIPGALVLEGFALGSEDENAGWKYASVAGDLVMMFGVRTLTTLGAYGFIIASGEVITGQGASFFAEVDGGGLNIHRPWRGWGVRADARIAFMLPGTSYDGFHAATDSSDLLDFSTQTGGSKSSTVRVRGCRGGRFFSVAKGASVNLQGDQVGTQNNLNMRTTPSVFMQLGGFQQFGPDATIRGVDTVMGGPLVVQGPNTALHLFGDNVNSIQHATSGQPVISVKDGGTIYLSGGPGGIGLGGGTADWLVDGVAIDPEVELAGSNDFYIGTKGSRIIRYSGTP